MLNLVSSQPRTTAQINSTEPPLAEVRYDPNCEECRNDDQCCFVYFYSLYCGRCRCSGCCSDEKQKKKRPQRRTVNNYTPDDVFDDDNITSFIDDYNVYRPTTYIDYNIVNQSDGNRGDLAVAGINYDSGHAVDHSGNRGYTGNTAHLSGQKHDERNLVNNLSDVHKGGESYSEVECHPYDRSDDHGIKSSVEDKSENVCYTVNRNVSGDHSLNHSGSNVEHEGHLVIKTDSAINSETVCYPYDQSYGSGNKNHSGVQAGFEDKAGNVCHTVGREDHSVSYSSGNFGHGGQSVMNSDSHTHWNSGDHAGVNRGNEDHSTGWASSNGGTGDNSGGGDTGGDSGGGGGDTGGDSGGGGGDSGGGADTGGDSGGGGGAGDD